MKTITYGKQYIDLKDVKIVSKSLNSNLITTGSYVKKFETTIQKYFDSKYVLSCTSGTSALDLSIRSIDLKVGEIVIMPAVTFIASYNICLLLGAKIYLADIDPLTGQMTPKTLQDCVKKNKLSKIKLIITMQMGGYPENIENFYQLKKKYNCFLIEDSCHAFGSKYNFKNKIYKIGSCKHSDISTFSLHPLKTITTGEGGLISTNNKKLFNKMLLTRSHGIIRNNNGCHWKYDVKYPGLNYRLSDINSALGLSQFAKLKKFINYRKKCYDYYLHLLKSNNEILKFPQYNKSNFSSYHLFLININFSKLKKNKNDFFKYMKENKIISQFHYMPIYKFSLFKEKKLNLDNSEDYYNNVVSLPIFYGLEKKQQKYIANKIIKYIKS